MQSAHKDSLRIVGESTAMLALALPLLVPFSVHRSIDMQACIVWALGVIAWVILFWQRQRLKDMRSWLWWPVGLYGLSCIATLWVHTGIDDLAGMNGSRLGVLTLLACIGCGLIVRQVPAKRLAQGIYASSVALAAVTIPYSLLISGNLSRTGGVFHQADFLAMWLVCGCIVGYGLWPKKTAYRALMTLSQLLVIGVILLTQTRAALLLLVVLSICIAIRELHARWRIMAIVLVLITAVLIGSVLHMTAPHNRILDRGYSSESLRYRASLQSYGVRAVRHQPMVGYGPGGIQNALSCLTFHDRALQETCRQGYYFDSSHDIFLDRFIALGIVGGLAFLVTVIGLLWAGIRSAGTSRYFWYAALAICLYYLTNVTSVGIELLLWILLCRFWGDHAK